jgi:Glycosyl hydrolase family 26
MRASQLVTDVLGTSAEWEFVRVATLLFAAGAIFRLIPVRRNGQKRRAGRPRYLAWASAAVAVAVFAGAGAYAVRQSRLPGVTVVSAAGWVGGSTSSAPTVPDTPYLGVFEPGAIASYSSVTKFSRDTGLHVGISLYYSAWNDPFQARFAGSAASDGAMPFVQMMPLKVSLASVAAGESDSYLRSYASAVRKYRHPVVIGFAPEMNGDWYAWGDGHTSPAVYVSAWRHLVDVFRQTGASNAIFLWTVNDIETANAPLKQWWPGASYVTWVGIDGYYYRSTDTFQSVFGTTLADLRTFTSKRVLISETAVGPNSSAAAQVNGLFQGVRANHLLGVVWFDQAQDDGVYHQDWHLEDDPAALSAFRIAAAITRGG